MKQVVQSPATGALELLEVPAPAPVPGQVIVRNAFSVVSPGTEKLALDFARKSLLGKARSRPDLVRQVTRKLRQEGPLPTYRAVRNRLDAPQPLGYSCAGVVVAVGPGVAALAPGDRVACAGAGHASHAEIVSVPENLCARVPDGVALEQACFATLGAIALQGIRVAGPTLGEIGVVIGLGLIGQLAAQCLRANGCRVLGIDVDPLRVKQALDQGAAWGAAPGDDHRAWRDHATGGHGADFALVTAASESSAPIALAAELCRMKGRIASVGATGLDLDRRSFYEKELELRMSTSYGPGRYDRAYEEEGLDYPLAWVRWTENRNLQAFLALIADGSVRPAALDAEIHPFEEAVSVYEDLAQGQRRSLAAIFRYAETPSSARELRVAARAAAAARESIGVGFVGAGNYAKSVLLPALAARSEARRERLVTAGGASARRSAEKFGFAVCGTDPEAVFTAPEVDLVVIATRHDSHASLACRALRAGKAVWLEKPVGLSPQEVDDVMQAAQETGGFLAVGYNRRFSPHTRAVAAAFEARRAPLAIRYSVAAGAPPRGSWILDPRVGGGRVVGEVCHFVDLCTHLVGAPPENVYARRLGRDPQVDDSLVALFGFADGSVATLEYLAAAAAELPKERFEVSCAGRTARCDNFKTTWISGSRRLRTLNQDKGQAAALAEVLAALRAGRPSPFALAQVAGVSHACFALLASLESGSREAVFS
jgi:predicted dehydrogenase/threonine dehydrogenase-like Zn-dependent dehydrogenase